MELAVGMFALALVVSALCLFATYVVRSLKVQNSMRGSAPQQNVTIKVEEFAELNFAGVNVLKMNEKWVAPPQSLVK